MSVNEMIGSINSKGDEVVYKIYGKFALQNGCPSGIGKAGH